MKALEAISAISAISTSQRGLFTSAQAQAAGVGKMTISRLARHGQIEQVARGVYRAAGAPSSREEDVYAAWLALNPVAAAWERPMDGTDFVASLNTAAWLHGLGELKPEPITFSHDKRTRSRNTRLRFLTRRLDDMEITVVAGIPVTTPARTILDLIEHDEDLSLIATVLADAERLNPSMNIRDKINSSASLRGFEKGFPLYDYLRGESDGQRISHSCRI